jgi:hypothetical protein
MVHCATYLLTEEKKALNWMVGDFMVQYSFFIAQNNKQQQK